MQWGSAAPTSYGGYIGSTGGLNTYYSYFIEVPSGVSSLVVDLFDADVGSAGTATELSLNLDRPVGWGGNPWNTSCTYTLYNPTGGSVATATGNAAGPAGSHNAWWNLSTTASPANGHWELRVRCGSGNDVNAYGIRAHDGTAGAGGTELNIYAHSFVPLGTNDTDSNRFSGDNRVNDLYPFVTSGCVFDSNDFDYDSARTGGTYNSSLVFTSRTTAFSQTIPEPSLSNNDVWANNVINGWPTDPELIEYGIWHLRSTIYELTAWGYSGNYTVLYFGNFNASNPPPTSQPEANTFRIYLPTDGSGQPPKPIASQSLAHVSGPNPPSSGSTTRVRISVGITNPTAQAITFSATDLVTVNVPGSGAVYAGNASVTQGSITSQPGIGGTGDITWNPGSVASGASAELRYEVDVTPSSGGQRIAVTGTPASNGTTAVYVDETGNTSQARATYTYGPLCELAVTENGNPIPTLATLSNFGAYSEGNKVVVEWETSSEVRTAGFNLYRKDDVSDEFVKLNEKLLVGLLHAPQGGYYRFKDASASVGNTYTYKIVEVEYDGTEIDHGPFTVEIGGGGKGGLSQLAGASYGRLERAGSARVPDLIPQQTLVSTLNPMSNLTEPLDGIPSGPYRIYFPHIRGSGHEVATGESVKVYVTETGLHGFSATDLATHMGISADEVINLIRRNSLRMTLHGQEISLRPFENYAGVYFFGEAIDSIYTDTNVYWLFSGEGTRIENVAGVGPTPVESSQTFPDTIHFEENHYALTGLYDDPEADYWLWEYIAAGDTLEGTRTFTLRTDGPSGAGLARLTLFLKGATDDDSYVDHHVEVLLNGTRIGDGIWDGTNEHVLPLDFDPALLHEGDNSIVVSGLLDTGVSHSIFYVDSFDLTYSRYYRAQDDSLIFPGQDLPVVTVTNFSNAHINLFDVTTPSQPVHIEATTIDQAGGTYRISFEPQTGERQYLAVSTPGLSLPDAIIRDKPSRLMEGAPGADYLIITAENLMASAQSLIDYRRSLGYAAQAIDLQDIYDEFNYGIVDPHAIKTFLAHAYSHWTPRPSYIVLLGDGTYDYKDYLGNGDNIVPTLLRSTPGGLFASDTSFADVIGNDGILEFALGRIPAVNTNEVASAVTKIIGFESSNGNPWSETVLLVADQSDDAGAFPSDSDGLMEHIPGEYSIDKIYLSELTLVEARNQLLDSINSGAGLVNYIGHSGIDRLASDGILLRSDMDLLSNGSKLPIFVAMTCVAGRFEIPGYDSLSEALMLDQDGGAIAVWAPSGISMNEEAVKLDRFFVQAIFSGSAQTIGQAFKSALHSYASSVHEQYILEIYNLLGDPATFIGWN